MRLGLAAGVLPAAALAAELFPASALDAAALSYVFMGQDLYRGVTGMLDAYASVIDASGASLLAFGTGARDTGVQTPRVLLGSLADLGTVTGSAVASLIQTGRIRSLKAGDHKCSELGSMVRDELLARAKKR